MFDDLKLGATGKFPEGKIRPDDEGELRAAIGVQKGQVVIDFGKPISWVSLPPDAARALGIALIRKAGAADGKVFSVEL